MPAYIKLKDFPIRPISPTDKTNETLHHRMIDSVTKMLDLHKKLSAARLPQDKDLIQRQIDATDRAIDTHVYDLYGLTQEERNIIEEAVR